MKVIHIPRRFVVSEWGGTETTILQLCRSMKLGGNDAKIFTSLALSNTREESVQGISVKRFPYCYPFWGLSRQAIEDMDKKGGNLLSFSLFLALLREPDVDVFHAHSGKRLGGIVRAVAKLRGIPYVITLHGGVFDVPAGESEQMLKPIENTIEWGKPFGALLGSRQVLEDAAAILCVGENEYRAAKIKLKGRRVEMMPNGVDSNFFAHGDGALFRSVHHIPMDRRLILCVGRIDYQKNQIALIESLAKVLGNEPKAHVLLIGPVTVAAYRTKLLAKIAELGLDSQVTLLPGMKPDDPMLVNAYHAADVFCLPSLHEPFGIVILEAWAAKLPVVAANVGGIPSFTADGEDVLLVDPHSPDSIANALTRVLSDRGLATRMADKGNAKACNQYDWSVISGQLLGIYESIR